MENQMINLRNKYHMVTFDKELSDTKELVSLIKNSDWVQPELIIVNCFPEYSSRVAHLVNHCLSHLNGNELFEQIDLQMPYPNMNQVWNQCDRAYQNFSKYLSDWVRLNVHTGSQYLFLSAAENLNQIRTVVKLKLEPSEYRLATVYIKDGDPVPDYWIEKYSKNLLFQWENMDNPNWNY